jgi:hypothetical protein
MNNIEQERYPFERAAKKLGRCDFSRYSDGLHKNERTSELFAMWLAAKSACETFYSRNAQLETENTMQRAQLSAKSPDSPERRKGR